jgi:endoglucanase
VNVSNFQPNAHSIHYGTWIAKCLHYAARLAQDKGEPSAFRRCASQPMGEQASDEAAWARAEEWYAKHVRDITADMAHFVIDTGRNGHGPLDVGRYAQPPFGQPESVVRGLAAGNWCNPPGTGLGQRSTADTRVPLLDAYLWIKTVGESDGACDIAGGARAWDYGRYNPWGLTGEAQKHFDPLWGTIDPAAGTWFPELALDLALHAKPPLSP